MAGRPDGVAADAEAIGGPSRLGLDADVAIAGAGPAGAAAAIACARAGLRVVLLERSALPRERPGETLHPGVEAPLRELGVLERVLDSGFARHPGVWAGWGEAPRFAAYGVDDEGPWHGFQAWRADFDALLVARAIELGAVVHEGCRALAPMQREKAASPASRPRRASCAPATSSTQPEAATGSPAASASSSTAARRR